MTCALCILLSAGLITRARSTVPTTQWMLHKTTEGREWALYRSHIDGSTTRRLSPDNNLNEFRGWSPDGAWMYIQRYENLQWEIYRQRPHGGQLENLSRHAAHDWFAALSPDGVWLYFQSNRVGNGGNVELFRMRADGSDVQQLTANQGLDEFITWGPGEDWLLYQNERQGNRELYRLNMDTRESIRLTRTPGPDFFQAWSPDGEWLVFRSFVGNNLKLHRVRTDGTQQEQLIFGAGQDTFHAWAPAGDWLLLSIDFGTRGELYRFRFAGQNVVTSSQDAPFDATLQEAQARLSEAADVPESFAEQSLLQQQTNLQRLTDTIGTDTFIDWLETGELLFQARHEGRSALWRAGPPQNLSTVPQAQPIAQVPGDMAFRGWVPNSDWLILRSLSGQGSSIYRVRPEGGTLQQLTPNSHHNRLETWTPEGDWLVFWSNRSQTGELYRMRPDGSTVQRLTHTPGEDAFVAWAPVVDLTWTPWPLGLAALTLLVLALLGRKIIPWQGHPNKRHDQQTKG
ncbi:MAG: TolB family protein [Anaerolineales bacterium]